MQRVIPWIDKGADAHRFTDHQRVADFAHVIHQVGQSDVLLEADNRPVDLYRAAPLHRHAQFSGDDCGHFIGTAAQLLGQCADVAGAHAGRCPRP
ncbi:hypothetical protein D9M71_827510 [compost metagenome]